MNREAAASSLFALVVVLAICLICGATLLAFETVSAKRIKAEELGQERQALDLAFDSWRTLWEKNAGASDSRFDEYASVTSLDGISVTAEDVSSKINPNWVDPELFEKTDLLTCLKKGVTPAELRQYRTDKGFSTDIKTFYSRFFVEDTFENLLSAYSYADINTSDEFALEDLYAQRSGDKAASAGFRERLRDRRMALQPFEVDDLDMALAPYMDTVFPVIAIAPTMNANFVPERVLSALLAYPAFSIPDAADRANLILSERAHDEITQERLYTLIGMARENPVYRSIGTKTWFWRLVFQKGSMSLTMVVARIPPRPGQELDAEKSPSLRVVSRKFAP